VGFDLVLVQMGLKPSTIKEVARGSVSSVSSLVYVLSKSSSLQLRVPQPTVGFWFRGSSSWFRFSQAKKSQDVSR